MGTFVNAGLVSLNARFKEVELILQEANLHFDTNEDLYSALCRSAQVLLSAHFEGYIKELIKNALDDINLFSNFGASNDNIKRRFCEHFVINTVINEDKNSKINQDRIKKLMLELEGSKVKFKKEHFSYDDNVNPKASIRVVIAC